MDVDLVVDWVWVWQSDLISLARLLPPTMLGIIRAHMLSQTATTVYHDGGSLHNQY